MPFYVEETPFLEGRYLAEVKYAEEKTSAAGNPMIVLTLKDATTGKKLCIDRLVFSDGAMNMTKRRLVALGMRKSKDPIGEMNADDFIGRRAFVHLVLGEFKGEPRIEVDANAKGTMAGYEPEFADGAMPSPPPPRAISHPDAKPPLEDEASLESPLHPGEVPF